MKVTTQFAHNDCKLNFHWTVETTLIFWKNLIHLRFTKPLHNQHSKKAIKFVTKFSPNSHMKNWNSRNYTPYVFQPNFLKQQSSFKVINNEAGVKVVHADQAGNGEEEDPKKKAGRKVIDWTSSCVLYVEVCWEFS